MILDSPLHPGLRKALEKAQTNAETEMIDADWKFQFDVPYTPVYEAELFKAAIAAQTVAINLLHDSGHISYKFAYNLVMITLIVFSFRADSIPLSSY
jgi:hypothetical protein